MQPITPALGQRLKSLHLPDAEIVNAIEWMEKGDAIAKALVAISRLFQRTPELNPAAR